MAPNGLADALSKPDVDHAVVLTSPHTSGNGHAAAQVDREDLAALAACLFDLRAVCETQLRTLTSLQRHLERVRRLGSDAPEADLLLTEISRQLGELQNGSLNVAECHGIAERTFRQIRSSSR